MKLVDDLEGEEFALSLTSMTDIVFLMLIFFMLATTYADPERALGLELPGAQSGAEPPEREIVINVLEDGRFVLAGETLGPQELRARLAGAAPETPVTIRGHRLARHEAIVRAMDACALSGLTNLSIGTVPDERG